MANPSLLILPGDGIGPEVMAQVTRIIDWFGEKRDLAFDMTNTAPRCMMTRWPAPSKSTPCCWAPLAAQNTTTSTSP